MNRLLACTVGIALLGVGTVGAVCRPSAPVPSAQPVLGRPISEDTKERLRGGDGSGGTAKKCQLITPGCPGKGCTVSSPTTHICVICDVPLVNGLCTTAGTGVPCNAITLSDCEELNPPVTAAKGFCSGTSCIPVNPQISISCGIYSTCP